MSMPQASGSRSSSSSSLNTHRIANARRPAQLRFHVSTASNSISDLRLQVSALRSGTTETEQQEEETKAVLRPSYFRERTLALNDEIVDRVVDATSGSVMWTIHRPVRGWYLHLRSPNLPRGSAIPLRPSRTAAADVAATPLCFNIGTTIDQASLSLCTTSLDMPTPLPSRSAFESVPLDGRTRSVGAPPPRAQPPVQAPTSPWLAGTEAPDAIELAARTTARAPSGPTHIRRRSAGGSGTHAPDVRKPSSSSGGSISVPASRNPSAGAGRLEPRTEEAEEDEDAGNSGSSSINADRPYEPVEPRMIPPAPTAARNLLSQPSSSRPHARQAPPSISAQSRQQPHARPRTCTFVLSDGVGATPGGWAHLNSAPAPGRTVEVQSRLGWARWAWGLLPGQLRPPLSLDTSKNFAIRWVDAPLPSGAAGAAIQEIEQEQGIEVLRFEDTSGWWLGAKTKGRIILQENAVKALRLETAFWIAVALAYLEFLEERDGYNAAASG